MAVTPLDLRQNGRDDTLSVSLRGFPVRSLTRNVHGKANGEWVMAYEMHQKHRLKLSIGGLSDDSHSTTNANIMAPGNTPSNGSAHSSRHALDKRLLLKQGYVDKPSDLCTVDVSGLELTNFKETDFYLFTSLASVNASDNQLTLEAFQSLPVIEELELPLNGIVNVDIKDNGFQSLTMIDLSYNYLSETAIIALGRLPQLIELHLTGNNFVSLPNDMSRPHRVQISNDESEVRISFQKLEKIWLDDNKLCDPTTFAILAGLRRLKYLNLDNNELTSIPHLKLLGTGLLQGHPPSHHQGDAESKEVNTVSTPRPTSSNTLSKMSSQALAPFPELHTISLCNNMILSGNSLLPCSSWPVLKELIIVGNPLVSMQKGLPQVLQNELTDKCSIDIIRSKENDKGKRRSLENKFKDMRKVSLTPPPLIPKQPILLAIEAPSSNGIDHEGSTLSLTNDEFPYTDNEDDMSSVKQYSIMSSQPTDRQQPAQDNSNGPGIFLTEFNQTNEEEIPLKSQTDDTREKGEVEDQGGDDGIGSNNNHQLPSNNNINKPIPTVKEMFYQRRKIEKEKFNDIPRKFKGFESLLDEDEDENIYYDAPPLPTGQYSCSKVLKYALDHPLLAESRKKKTKSKIKREVPVAATLGTTGDYLKTKPIREQYHDVPAVSSRKQKVSSLIQELQAHQTSVEVNLQDVLNQKDLMKRITMDTITSPLDNSKNWVIDNDDTVSMDGSSSTMTKKEGKELLTKLQTKYDKIREVSLATIAAIDSAHSIAKVASGKPPSQQSIS